MNALAPKTASTDAPVHPLLAERWSPRGFATDHSISEETMTSLLEAARWAPSANNSQPWRFLVTRRGEESHEELSGLLAPGNQSWAPHASALLLVAAQTRDEQGRERAWALYDTGQAVAALTVQAEAHGLSVHQMGGFNATAAREAFDLDESLQPVVVVAIGQHDVAAELPEPLHSRERAPRTREPLSALLLDGQRRDQRVA